MLVEQEVRPGAFPSGLTMSVGSKFMQNVGRLKRRNEQRVNRDNGKIGDRKRKEANRLDRERIRPKVKGWHNEQNVWCLKSDVQSPNYRSRDSGKVDIFLREW